MAVVRELDQAAFKKWAGKRPKCIQKMLRSHPPDRLYRMRTTGSRVLIYSYAEDGTVTVSVLGLYNRVTMERNVFGIPLSDLTECDLPAEDELLGCVFDEMGLSPDEQIEAARSMMKARGH